VSPVIFYIAAIFFFALGIFFFIKDIIERRVRRENAERITKEIEELKRKLKAENPEKESILLEAILRELELISNEIRRLPNSALIYFGLSLLVCINLLIISLPWVR